MNMSADKTTLGSDTKDPSLIRDLELQDWAKKLGVSHKELEDAAGVVGCNAHVVHQYLQGRSGHAGHEADT
jgi:hypothetical protein